jgi:hypothetical protein
MNTYQIVLDLAHVTDALFQTETRDTKDFFMVLVFLELALDRARTLPNPAENEADTQRKNDVNRMLVEIRKKIAEVARNIPQPERKAMLEEAGRMLPTGWID